MTFTTSILRRIVIALMIAVGLLCPLGRSALAQQKAEISVNVQAPQSMYVGDRNNFMVQIHGSRDAAVPVMPALPEFTFAYAGPSDQSSQMTTIVNGRVDSRTTINYSHVFTITAKAAGVHTIPAFDVTVDGRRYTTRPVTIEVLEPKPATDSSLAVVLDHKRAYVGQPVRVTMTWALGVPVRGYELSLPIEGDAELLPGPDPRPPGTSPQDNRYLNLTLNGQNVIGRMGQTQIGGRNVNAVIVEQVIIPRSPGTIRIGPARADLNAVIGRRERQPMDSLFDDLAMTERQFVKAPTLDLAVNALPADGRPADFSGLVGSYAINALADTKDVAMGDPINLTVTVTGPYPLSLVPPLDLNTQPSLREKFRLPRDPLLADVTPLSARFDAIIRPRSAEIKEIGPVELNYFDTDTGTYKVMATRPLPLTVRPGTQVDLPGGDDEPTALAHADKLEALPEGLAGIRRSPIDDGFSLARELRRPRTIALIALPPLTYAAAFSLVALRRRHERDPALRRRLRAARRFRATVRKQTHAPNSPAANDALAHALANFAADWADQHDDALTATQTAEIFESAHTPSGTELGALVRSIDAQRFGGFGSGSAASDPHTEAVQLVQRFVRERTTRRAAA